MYRGQASGLEAMGRGPLSVLSMSYSSYRTGIGEKQTGVGIASTGWARVAVTDCGPSGPSGPSGLATQGCP